MPRWSEQQCLGKSGSSHAERAGSAYPGELTPCCAAKACSLRSWSCSWSGVMASLLFVSMPERPLIQVSPIGEAVAGTCAHTRSSSRVG